MGGRAKSADSPQVKGRLCSAGSAKLRHRRPRILFQRLMTDPLFDSTFDATPRGPFRTFTDDVGREWLVWHLAEDVVEELREASSVRRAWLIFLGPNGETRRLAPVLPKWRRMKDQQLYELAQRASDFVARRSP